MKRWVSLNCTLFRCFFLCLGVAFVHAALDSSSYSEAALAERYIFSHHFDGGLQVYWSVNTTSNLVHVALRAATTGYVAFGRSESSAGLMPGGRVVIGFVDSGVSSVHEYKLPDRSTPQRIYDDESLLSATAVELDGSVTVVEYSKPSSEFDIAGSNTMIYAVGSRDRLTQHSSRGAASFYWSTGKVKTKEYRELELLHGLFMFVGFLVLFPSGLFVARFCRSWKHWFVAHLVLQNLGVICAVIGISLGFAMNEDKERPHVDSLHAQIGIATVAALGYQYLHGLLRSKKPQQGDENEAMKRAHYTCWRAFHRPLGYLIIILATIVAFLGAERLAESYEGGRGFFPILLLVWTIAVGVTFLLREIGSQWQAFVRDYNFSAIHESESIQLLKLKQVRAGPDDGSALLVRMKNRTGARDPSAEMEKPTGSSIVTDRKASTNSNSADENTDNHDVDEKSVDDRIGEEEVHVERHTSLMKHKQYVYAMPTSPGRALLHQLQSPLLLFLCVVLIVLVVLSGFYGAKSGEMDDRLSSLESRNRNTVREFTLKGYMAGFKAFPIADINPTIRVNKGDTVIIKYINGEKEPHNLWLDTVDGRPMPGQETVVRTGAGTYGTDRMPVLENPGEEASVIIKSADVPGVYFYYCAVGNHRDAGMEGILIVCGEGEECGHYSTLQHAPMPPAKDPSITHNIVRRPEDVPGPIRIRFDTKEDGSPCLMSDYLEEKRVFGRPVKCHYPLPDDYIYKYGGDVDSAEFQANFPNRTEPAVHHVTLVIEEVVGWIEPGVTMTYFTYNRTVPGPMVRVRGKLLQ